MSKVAVQHPDKLVSTGAYSAGILVDGWLYVSGQGPLDMKTGKVVAGTIEEQTRLTLDHIVKILTAAGATLDDVVKCTCHLKDIRHFDRFNAVYAEFFTGVQLQEFAAQYGRSGGLEKHCFRRFSQHPLPIVSGKKVEPVSH
jgi:2-iminobutanoate/2-iminopropanoate deaminase